MEENRLLTLPQIASHFGMPGWRVKYAISAYGIEPATSIGGTRVWTYTALEKFHEAFKQISANRAAGPPKRKKAAGMVPATT